MAARILRAGRGRSAQAAVWPPAAEAAARQPLSSGALEEDWKQRLAEAHRAGRQQGENEAQERLTATLTRLARAIEETASLRPRLRKEAEQDLVRLAMAVARRILHRELSTDPMALQGLVTVALDRLAAQEIFQVRIHPGLEAALEASLARLAPSHKIEILVDGSRPAGELVFETGRGSLDASVDTQLHEIERGLADRLGTV